MPKGGKRETSFRPTWNHVPTIAIRVPQEFAPLLVSLAREWDELEHPPILEATRNTASVTPNIEAIAAEVLEDPTGTRGGKDKGAVKRAIAAFIEQLRKV